jgi:hypothetical protein
MAGVMELDEPVLTTSLTERLFEDTREKLVHRPVGGLLPAVFAITLCHSAKPATPGINTCVEAVAGVALRARLKDSEFSVEIILSYRKTKESLL